MQTSFPTANGYSSTYLIGYRRGSAAGEALLSGIAVVKRYYEIVGNTLVPAPDPVGLRITDEQESVNWNGESFAIPRYEHDLAIFKPVADLIIRDGFIAGHTYEAQVQSTGGTLQTWLSRTFLSPPPPVIGPDADAQEHLFGWQPRYEGERFNQGQVPQSFPNPASEIPDLSNFDNLFFNGYRRDFSQPGFPLTQYAPGDRIRLQRIPTGSSNITTEFDFKLGQEQIRANLYVYSGSGRDLPTHWCVEVLPDVRLDTLVVTPAENTAYVLWRVVWDFSNFPTEHYRKLDIVATGGLSG